MPPSGEARLAPRRSPCPFRFAQNPYCDNRMMCLMLCNHGKQRPSRARINGGERTRLSSRLVTEYGETLAPRWGLAADISDRRTA